MFYLILLPHCVFFQTTVNCCHFFILSKLLEAFKIRPYSWFPLFLNILHLVADYIFNFLHHSNYLFSKKSWNQLKVIFLTARPLGRGQQIATSIKHTCIIFVHHLYFFILFTYLSLWLTINMWEFLALWFSYR